MSMARRYHSLFERLVANSATLEGQNECGCWRWTGRTDGRAYGKVNVRVNGRHKALRAHRAMENALRISRAQLDLDDAQPGPWWSTPLPTLTEVPVLDQVEETLDHLCYEGLCINPDHWEPVHNAVNASRSQQRNPRVPVRFTRALASAKVSSR